MTRYLLLLLLLLSACRNDEPQAPTPEQSNQLNDAEDMLNKAAQNEAAQNEEGPEANASSPSNSSD